MKAKNHFKFAVLYLFLMVTVFCSLFFGAQNLSFEEIFFNAHSFEYTIFMNLRLPRTILCIEAGALLASSGAVFQQYFRNPLADSGIMGLSSGATLFAVIFYVIALPLLQLIIPVGTTIMVALGAIAGAILSGIMVTVLSTGISRLSTVSLLLCGTCLGTLYSAVTSIILSTNTKDLGTMYLWMLGSMNGRGWNEVLIVTVLGTVAEILLFRCTRKLDLLSCGEDSAYTLGVNVRALRTQVLLAGSVATAAAVCAGGTIGFIGIICPHISRKLFGVNSRSVWFTSLFTGAVLLTLSDILCRLVIAPAELPVGTITAILGVPFFISLLAGGKHGRK